MVELLLQVLPLGIGSAITTRLFALQVLVLASRKRPWPPALAVIAGSAAVVGVVTILGLTVLVQLPDTGIGLYGQSWQAAAIELIAAALLVVLAIRLAIPRPTVQEKASSRIERLVDSASPAAFVGISAVMTVTDVSSFLLYLPALHDVTQSNAILVGRVLVGILLFLLILVPVWVPATMVRVGGAPATARLQRGMAWLTAHDRQVGAGVAIVFAGYLAWRGIRAM